LKKKNILKINGKEMLYYSIKSAKESMLFEDHIFVSTESEEIRDVAVRHGAKVPYLRNEKLAHDPYGVVDVALDFLEKNPVYKDYDNIFILLPTAPLTLGEDVLAAYGVYKRMGYKYLMSVAETDHNALSSVFVRDGRIDPIFQDQILKPACQLEKTYRVNGAVTIMNIEDFLITRNYYIFPLGAYVMPKERSVDIDTEFDFRIAKLLIENRELFERSAQ
jgi:CMP-N-acetylneuraminic acid synthetase